jgi:hypothetical protein
LKEDNTHMDRHTASALDRWLTTPPEPIELPLPGDEDYPRCTCGRFLKRDPERTEARAHELPCTGVLHEWGYTDCDRDQPHAPHTAVLAAWDEAHRTCRACGHDNIEVLA